MNEYRKALRLLVSRARHAQKEEHRRLNPTLYCSSCHCDTDIYSTGCKTCHDRKRRRAKRDAMRVPCSTPGCEHTIINEERRPGIAHRGQCQHCYRRRNKVAA